MFSLILFLIAILAAIIHISARKKARTTSRVVEIFLGYLIPLNIGVMSFIGFLSQAFYGKQMAEMMGWDPNPAFQFELAVMHLGFAIVGFLSIWQRKGFWLATVLTNSIFLLGCGWAHISQLMHGVKATWHGFIFLYVNDIVVPIVLLVLTLIYSAKNKFFKEKAKG
jgi:hypothetical protein